MEKIMLSGYDAVHENFEEILAGTKKGTIQLPVPILNILDYAGEKPVLGRFSGLSREDLDKVAHYSAWAVTDPGSTDLAAASVLTDKELLEAREKYGADAFTAMTGAEAVYGLVKGIDYKGELEKCREKERSLMAELEALRSEDGGDEDEAVEITEYEEGDVEESEAEKLSRELAETRAGIDAALYMQGHLHTGILIREIRVLPMEIRALAKENAASMPYAVYHDLESLYSAVSGRAETIRRLIEMDAPEIILRNEGRMLQEAADALIANGMKGVPKTKGDGTPLCSLMDVLARSVRMI